MDLLTLILLAIILFLLIAQWWFLAKKKQDESSKKDEAALTLLQQQLNQVSQTVDVKLAEANRLIHEQFGQSFKIISDVTQKLTQLDNTNKQIIGFAQQLQSLENILKNPKQRGILGEYYLETVLKNVLPPSVYQMQYKFKNGEIVDAVVFVKDKIIPIDSKFSLENYNKIVTEKETARKNELEKIFKNDLKNRIDETAKYIRPDENTMDFALMYIPSEGVYYDLLVNDIGAVKVNTRDLIEYAFQKRVIVVSPTNFLAYLQTILQGLRALQIEESAKEIRQRVEMLGRHLTAYSDFLERLGGHLTTTVNAYEGARKEFLKIDKDILKITGEDRQKLEIKQINHPGEN